MYRIPQALHSLSGQRSGHLVVNIEHFGFPNGIFFGVYPLLDAAQFIFQSSKNNQFLLQVYYLHFVSRFILPDRKSTIIGFKSYEDML